MSVYAKEFKKGEVIFKEGDAGDCMYYITGYTSEKIGLYTGYGTDKQVLITEISTGKFFGEMAIIDDSSRSATAVALTDVVVDRISKSEFRDYFTENKGYMLELLKQSANNLRRLTDDYMKACDLVRDYVKAKEAGGEISDSLLDRLAALSN